MPGIVAKLVMKNLMKNKPKNVHYVPRDYVAAREKADKQRDMLPLPKYIRCTKEQYGYWFDVEGANRSKVVFQIHGGGFNTGDARNHNAVMIELCKRKKYSVFSVQYRLAPEYPYPAGLEDCIRAYEWLLSQGISGKDIVLLGDSAGGNLVFALALYLRDHGIELPAGICGISPVGTLDDSLTSRTERVDRDCIIGTDFTEEMQVTYVLNQDVKKPYLSPIYGDFSGFPPIWICVGTEEVFYDDAFVLRDLAVRCEVPVELLVGEGMCHVYPFIPDRESTKAIKSMRNFIEKCLL